MDVCATYAVRQVVGKLELALSFGNSKLHDAELCVTPRENANRIGRWFQSGEADPSILCLKEKSWSDDLRCCDERGTKVNKLRKHMQAGESNDAKLP